MQLTDWLLVGLAKISSTKSGFVIESPFSLRAQMFYLFKLLTPAFAAPSDGGGGSAPGGGVSFICRGA
jgi:hypothetical protein